MKSILYQDLTGDEHSKFCQFLKTASAEPGQLAGQNMWSDGDHKNTLLYLLDHTDRFGKNGMFQILFDRDTVVACSGAYTSEFSSAVAILGVRSWVHPDYRSQLISRNFLLPIEKQWAVDRLHSAVMLTFNEYNRHLQSLFLRKRLGVLVSERTQRHFGYNGVHTIDHPITVQYTKQYAIYEKLDPDFCFDWQSIRHPEHDIVSTTAINH